MGDFTPNDPGQAFTPGGPRVVGASDRIPGAVVVEAANGQQFHVAPQALPADLFAGANSDLEPPASIAAPQPQPGGAVSPQETAALLERGAANVDAMRAEQGATTPAGGGIDEFLTQQARTLPGTSLAGLAGTPGAAPPMASPVASRGFGGGPVVRTDVTTATPLLSPQQQAELGRLGAESQGAGEDVQDGALGIAATQAALQERLANLNAGTGVDVAMERQRREDERAQQMAALRRQGEAVANAAAEARNFREDPDRIFGPGGRRSANGIISGIAVALGQLGAGLSGGPNTALQILNQRIDRDVESQRAQARGLRGDVGAQQGLYANLRAALGDDDAASAATRAGIYEGAAHQAEILGERSQSDEVRQNAQLLAAQLRQQSADSQRQAILGAAPVVTTHTRTRTGGGGGRRGAAPAGAAAPAPVNMADRRANAKAQANLAALDSAIGESEAAGRESDMTGIGGAIAGAANNFTLTRPLVPDAMQRTAGADGRLLGLYLQMLSGGQVSEEEFDRTAISTGLAPGASTEQRTRGIAAIRSGLEAKRRALRAGAAPETEQEFDTRTAAARAHDERGSTGNLSSFRAGTE